MFSFSQLVGLGSLQGILVALYLFSKPGVSRILALFLALISINMSVSFYIDAGIFEPSMYFVSLWRVINSYLLLGPVLFMFVVHMLEPERKWQYRDCWHLLPFVLSIIHSFVLINTQSMAFFDLVSSNLQQVTEQPLNERFSLNYTLPAVHFITYVSISCWYVLRYWLKAQGTIKLFQLYWLLAILALSLLMMISAALTFITAIIIGAEQSENTFAIANFSTVFGFFALSYLLIRFDRPVVLVLPTQGKVLEGHALVSSKEQSIDSNLVSQDFKEIEHPNKADSLNDYQQQQLVTLESLMTKERYYLNPELSQQSLAQALKLTRHQLSELLSLHQTGSFYELVNHYRVAAVVEAMKSRPSTDNLINIAYDCGFSSKSSFNQVFKKHKQQTPSQFRKSLR